MPAPKKPAAKKPAPKKPEAKKPASTKPAPKKPASTKPAAKKSSTSKSKGSTPTIKVPAGENKRFPWPTFPVKILHMDGKNKEDLKICWFQSENHAEKYITRYKLKKTDYVMYKKNV